MRQSLQRANIANLQGSARRHRIEPAFALNPAGEGSRSELPQLVPSAGLVALQRLIARHSSRPGAGRVEGEARPAVQQDAGEAVAKALRTPATAGPGASSPIVARAPSTELRKSSPPAKTSPFAGTLFLPGDDHVGHEYTIKGDQIVEKPEKRGDEPKAVATLDAQGNYYLLDAEGAAATAPSGKLADLVGDIHIAGPKPAPTVTKSSGRFSLQTADGTAVALTVNNGAVYTAEEPSRLVGNVTATGEYAVRLGDEVRRGSLEQLQAGKSQFAGTRKVDGQAQPGLSIQSEAISLGVVSLGGVQLRIKDGHLFKDQARVPVGQVVLIRAGAGADQTTKAIPYEYTDADGKVVNGDLLKDAGEQSYYRVGEEYRVRVGAAWVNPGKLTKDKTGKYYGFRRSGGGRLTNKLMELRQSGRLEITDAEITIFQSIATPEADGQVQQINTYDSAVVSFGFKQWTLQEQGELPKIIARAPDAFKRYGIELEGQYTINGNRTSGIKGVSDPEDLRGAFWAERFYQAGLDDDIIIAEVAQAKQDLASLRGTIQRSSFLQSGAGLDLLLELQNNRGAYVKDVVNRTLPATTDQTTEVQFLEIFVNQIVRAYAEDPVTSRNGGRAGGIEKSLRWTGKILNERGHGAVAEKVKAAWTAAAGASTPAAAR